MKPLVIIITLVLCVCVFPSPLLVVGQSEIPPNTRETHLTPDGRPKIHVNSEWITPLTTVQDTTLPELVCDSEQADQCITAFNDRECDTASIDVVCTPCYSLLMSCFRDAKCQNEGWYEQWLIACLDNAGCTAAVCSSAPTTSHVFWNASFLIAAILMFSRFYA
jgi:hypothetical protein